MDVEEGRGWVCVGSVTQSRTPPHHSPPHRLINNPQSLDSDILKVYGTVDIFNFASTLVVYR